MKYLYDNDREVANGLKGSWQQVGVQSLVLRAQLKGTKLNLWKQGSLRHLEMRMMKPFAQWSNLNHLELPQPLAVKNGLKLHQMDMKTAFLNGSLGETCAYICNSQRVLSSMAKNTYANLNKAFMAWSSNPNVIPASIYMASKGEVFIIAVYVDDILLAGKGYKRMEQVISRLSVWSEVYRRTPYFLL